MIVKNIIYFGQSTNVICDGKCHKAWGMNSRPRNKQADFLSDANLPDAPDDPLTYEGSCAKPKNEKDRLNKWCVRECERSVVAKNNEDFILTEF